MNSATHPLATFMDTKPPEPKQEAPEPEMLDCPVCDGHGIRRYEVFGRTVIGSCWICAGRGLIDSRSIVKGVFE